MNQDVLEPRVSKHLVDKGYKKECPDGKQFAVCFTHNVDEIYPPCKHILLSTLTCLKGLDFSGFKRQLSLKLYGKEKSPYQNFLKIMHLKKKYGACFSFYFLATGLDTRRSRFNIKNLEAELGQTVGHGRDIGLHGSYYAYNYLEGRPGERR